MFELSNSIVFIIVLVIVCYLIYRILLSKKFSNQKIQENTTIHVFNLASRYKKKKFRTIGNSANGFNPDILLKNDFFSFNLNSIFTKNISQNYTNISGLEKGKLTGLTIQFKDDSQDLYIIFFSKNQRDRFYDFLALKAKI